MPQALYCGCPYDLFWTLNPKRLEPFIAAKRMELDNNTELMHVQTFEIGLYVQRAVASCFNKNASYPQKPLFGKGSEKYAEDDEHIGQKLTDADKFMQFIIVRNAARKNKKAEHTE